MARIARVVVPGFPHHVTQRGNRRQRVFFSDDDYRAYRDLMAAFCHRLGVEIWAYCLMPNHVHMIAVPGTADALCRAIGEAHRRYTRMINLRQDWRGYLWQGRFASFVLEQGHCLAAARYIELNPVKAGLTPTADAWPWSSARAHLWARDDGLVTAAPLLGLARDWGRFLGEEVKEEETLRAHERTGRPWGSDSFIDTLEEMLDRPLRPQKAGRKKKTLGK